jgi:hypothetical protein
MSWEVMQTKTGPCACGAGTETCTLEMEDWNRTRSATENPLRFLLHLHRAYFPASARRSAWQQSSSFSCTFPLLSSATDNDYVPWEAVPRFPIVLRI